MNERIQKIALQCGAWHQVYGQRNFMIDEHFDIDKFTKFILLECNMALTPYLRDMISRGQACDLINKHFGVEE